MGRQHMAGADGDSATGYILYGTTACHLCEVAEGLLQLAQDSGLPVSYEAVDISECDTLFERYGWRIPVLRSAAGAELDWPFSPEQLLAFLEH